MYMAYTVHAVERYVFNNQVIANYPQKVPVKEFLKSINI